MLGRLTARLRERGAHAKREAYVLYLACRDPRTPWYARAVAAALMVYVFSPIDPIPDFIPVLGYLDELILVPLGVALVRRLVPSHVLEECRRRVESQAVEGQPVSRFGAALVVLAWLAIAALGVWLGVRLL